MSWQEGNGIDKYLGLIPSQHRTKPKFMAVLAAYLEKLQDGYSVLMQLDDAFDLDKAIGVQLDVLGEIVGTGRLLTFNPFYGPSLLQDDYFQRVIKAKISMNQWDGRYVSLLELWDEVFPDYDIKLVDFQDMSNAVRFFEMHDLFEAELITRGYFAPKPEGVLVNFEFHMQSKGEGQLYHAGAVTNELVHEKLHYYNFGAADTYASGELFYAGIATDVITEALPGMPVAPEEMAIHGRPYYGGAIAAEYITQHL